MARGPGGGSGGSGSSGRLLSLAAPLGAAGFETEAGDRATAAGPARQPDCGVDIRTAEAPVAPMDGGSGAARMTSEAVLDSRPWIAVEYDA